MSKYGGSRYKILKAYKEESLKWDTIVWTFYWEDKVTLEQGSVNFEVTNQLIYQGYDGPEFMLADTAAHAMCDKEFKYAVLEWYESQKHYNHYNTKWYDVLTTDFSATYETEKFIGKDGKYYVQAKQAWIPDITKGTHEKLMSEVYGNGITYEFHKGGLVNDAKAVASVPSASSYVHQLPGVNEYCNHPKPKNDEDAGLCNWSMTQENSIPDTIMHLNDRHKWTREEIADWLETLDVDLRFKTPEQKAEEKKRKELDGHRAMLVEYEKQMKSTAAALEALKANAEKCADKIKKLQEALNVED